MAPLYDYECPSCRAVFEQIAKMEEDTAACERCPGEAKRIISSKSAYKVDASWVNDCTVAFDPEDTRPEVRAYHANPGDRSALRRAMRVTGIRHLDDGEGKAQKEDTSSVHREVLERYKARNHLV